MNSKIRKSLSIFLALLIGCGSRDYGTEEEPLSREEEIRQQLQERPELQHDSSDEVESFSEDAETKREGWLWQGLDNLKRADWLTELAWLDEVQEPNQQKKIDDLVESLKEKLADDDPSRSNFDALGLTLMGASILGAIARISHLKEKQFLQASQGDPQNPQGPAQTDWIMETGKSLQKAAILGLGCYVLFSGFNPFFPGVFGQDYAYLSAATVVTLFSAHTGFSIRRALIKNGPYNNWSPHVSIKKGVLYHVGGGLFVLGVSSGLGLLVYNFPESESE